MPTLLVVEDDPTLNLSLRLALVAEGYDVRTAKTLADASVQLDDGAVELMLLDLGLPDGDGLTLCRQVREAGNFMPIIAVTARDTLSDRIDGLVSGADDYITKPFDLPELLARVAAQLRRKEWPMTEPARHASIGRLTFDRDSRSATSDGAVVHLSDMEFRLLEYFLAHAGKVVSRADLLTNVWGYAPTLKTRSVDTFVYRLRKLIEPNPKKPIWLISVRGAGYRLNSNQ